MQMAAIRRCDTGESKASWDEVGDRFGDLGQRLRGHYDGAGADRQAVGDALRALGDALNRAATALGQALRDPGVRDDARRAVERGRFLSALGCRYPR